MSNKPPKKSDKNKPWIEKRRDRHKLINTEYHLIVSEGEKTEPNYFNGLKRDIGENGRKIKIEIPTRKGSKNPLMLVDSAQKYVDDYRKNDIYIKHVWVVYDKDDVPDNIFNDAAEKCGKISNDEITYHALWSNESVEYWFVLHYEYLNTDTGREDYYPKLSKYMKKEYDKADEKIYDILKPQYKEAIKNAKRMMKEHGNAKPSECRPGTRIYEIFDYLKAYIK